MLACKQVTQLASAALDRKLSVAEQIQLRDWNLSVVGKAAALAETRHNFESVESLQIEILSLFESADGVAGELRILINGRDELYVVDVLPTVASPRSTPMSGAATDLPPHTQR